MAITVLSIPSPNNTIGTTAIGQIAMLSATSTNVLLDGFKYYITAELTSVVNGQTTVTELEFYISPNPQGLLLFNAASIFSSYVKTREITGNSSIHSYRDDSNQLVGDNSFTASVTASEAWIIGGVLTVDGASTELLYGGLFFNAHHQIEEGYYPSIYHFKLDGVTKRMLSDRKKDTYKFTLEPLINSDTDAIIIPVREQDFGVIMLPQEGSGLCYDSLDVTICTETNTLFTESFPQIDANFAHAAVYPANLNGSAMVLTNKPQDYPNWKYLKVQAQGENSAPYYLVNIDHYGIHQECKHNNVRIAWVGSRGGWEYFNFYKKNEESVQVERKRYQKVIGTYAGATFDFEKTDAGLKEIKPIVQRFITVNSDWIQEGEFEYLKGLIVSDTVHMVLDSGTHIPVLVEQNDYTAARERNGKLKNLTLKFRYANDLNT